MYQQHQWTRLPPIWSVRPNVLRLELSVQLGWEEALFEHFDAVSQQEQGLITAYRTRASRNHNETTDDRVRVERKRKVDVLDNNEGGGI
jgi:hypothetical protein